MALLTDYISFLNGPNSVMIATQDGALKPTSTRALSVRCVPNTDRVLVWLPAAVATRALANLQAEKRIAIGCSRASTHKTLQLKGHVVGVRTLPEEARAQMDEHFALFIHECEQVGLPPRILDRVVTWPAVELDVAVHEVFDQTPGPGAGERCAGRAPV